MKFYVLSVGVGSDLWLLSFVLVISSAIGGFYYLRVIVRMYLSDSEQRPSERARVVVRPVVSDFVLAAFTLALVWFGVCRAPLMNLIQSAITHLA
jgi:NADH-quinone oxidoreductase subunit N